MKQSFSHIRDIIGLKIVEFGIAIVGDEEFKDGLYMGLHFALTDSIRKERKK